MTTVTNWARNLNNYESVFLLLLLLLLLRCHTSLKKLIHFLTQKERPDFDGPKSKIAQNCPKIIFAFDRKFQNSKTKHKNYPLKSKNTF